jgi:hypothetical protein
MGFRTSESHSALLPSQKYERSKFSFLFSPFHQLALSSYYTQGTTVAPVL